MLVTHSQTAADIFALKRDKYKCDNSLKSFTLVKRCVTTQHNHCWCSQCAYYLIRVTTNLLVTNCHFSTEKSNCNYCMSMRHQCVLICAPEFHMLFTDYSQVPLNYNQSLTAISAQIRLLYTSDASILTEDSMCASAQVLSHQITASVRSSNLIRASLLLAASTDSVTETDIWMLINAVQHFVEVVATAVSMPSTCESLTCY